MPVASDERAVCYSERGARGKLDRTRGMRLNAAADLSRLGSIGARGSCRNDKYEVPRPHRLRGRERRYRRIGKVRPASAAAAAARIIVLNNLASREIGSACTAKFAGINSFLQFAGRHCAVFGIDTFRSM